MLTGRGPAAEIIRNPDRLFIGRRWTAPTSSAQIEVIAPATVEIALVTEALAPAVDAAVGKRSQGPTKH